MALTQVSRGLLSTSIDDNGTSTAITIDSSENVLVGKTNTTFGTAGIENRADGRITSTRSGNTNLLLNRLSSDGSLIDFHKDGTTIGSISTISDDLIIFSSTASHVGLRFGNTRLQPTDNAGATSDGVSDLGFSNSRFKEGFFSSDLNIINPAEDERGLSITDEQDGGQNLKFLYNASSNVGRVINDNADQLRFNGAQGAMINTPSFSAVTSSDVTTTTGANKILFPVQLTDTAGGHYNTATSAFTAPHDGTYFFSTSITYEGGDGVDDTMYVTYYVNDASSAYRQFQDNWRANSGTGVENHSTYSTVISLSENDYVTVVYSGLSAGIKIRGTYSKFCGFALSLT